MLANALFRLPNEDKIYFIKGQMLDITKNVNFNSDKPCFVVSPYAQKNMAYIIFIDEIEEWNNETFELHYNTNFNTNTSQKEYKNYVSQAIGAIKNKHNVNKIVCARVKNIDKKRTFDEYIFFKKLSQNYPSAFTYLISSPTTGTWLGASPELLLQYKNSTITTVALAGTLPNDDAKQWSKKEIIEHKWVEDFITETLNSFAKNILQSKANTIVMGNIKHIKSVFISNLKNDKNTALELLKKINPTPAVCGLPQGFANNFIQKNEGFERQLYSGFIGLLNYKKESQLYVNIRCAQILKNSINLYAGAGITASSIPQKEWVETENKIAALDSFL